MIALLTATLAASTPGCLPVSGADPLWQRPVRWVIVGEMHGTNELPDAFANLVCLAAATRRPVVVAVEHSSDGQAVIDGYLASNGDDRARAALLTLPAFTAAFQDGRGSAAFLRLWDTLRRLKQAGRIKGVVASDVGSAAVPGRTRDAQMAANWTAIAAPEDAIILALVGNVHAMRLPMQVAGRTIATAGSLMPADRTLTINVVAQGGMAWGCQADGCKVHDIGRPVAGDPGIQFLAEPNRRWDASYQLGHAMTASTPAVPHPAVPAPGRIVIGDTDR